MTAFLKAGGQRGRPTENIRDRDRRRTHHVMTLSATGEAETPAGGSVCMRCVEHEMSAKIPHMTARASKRLCSTRSLDPGHVCRRRRSRRTLKSRMRRRRAEVDMAAGQGVTSGDGLSKRESGDSDEQMRERTRRSVSRGWGPWEQDKGNGSGGGSADGREQDELSEEEKRNCRCSPSFSPVLSLLTLYRRPAWLPVSDTVPLGLTASEG
ncbi:hypothetical protein VTN00DRAFT_10059 [Thermoascus crustaceus]|uniref:uncharacterized protein n=1 Tax=Thermoascus crustaceus TaxID=5088 RepID=UPI003743140C